MSDSQFPSNSPVVVVTESQLSLSDVTTENVSTTKHGFAPKAPNDATKFLDGTGAYSTPPTGAGVPSGTAVWPWTPRTSNSSGYTGYTVMLKLGGSQLLSLPASWKFSFYLGSAASWVVGQAVVFRTLANDLSTIDSTTVTWGSSTTPTLGAGVTFSDAISLQLDNDHDYWIMVYFSSTSGNIELGTAATFANTFPFQPQKGYAAGNQISVSGTTINYAVFTPEEDLYTVISN